MPTPLILSGGKEDLGALAMFDDSVKKQKSPKVSPRPALSKAHADTALSLLARAVPFSATDHPMFRDFLHQVGLPPFSRRDLAGAQLDARCSEAQADTDAHIQDTHFFQLASDGWAAIVAAGGRSGSGEVLEKALKLIKYSEMLLLLASVLHTVEDEMMVLHAGEESGGGGGGETDAVNFRYRWA